MEMLSLKECQQAMAALDAADKLNASVENELSQFKTWTPTRLSSVQARCS